MVVYSIGGGGGGYSKSTVPWGFKKKRELATNNKNQTIHHCYTSSRTNVHVNTTKVEQKNTKERKQKGMNLEMHTFVTTVRYFSLRHSHLKNTQSQLQFRLKLEKEGNGAGGGGSAPDKKKKQSQTARVLTTQGAKQNCRVKKKNQTRHTHNTHTEGGNGRKHNLRL